MILVLPTVQAVSAQDQLQRGDLIINEILFNPATDGFDFVEGYNRSNKIIDLRTVRLANRNRMQEVQTIRSLASREILLLPGAYFVATSNELWLKKNYRTGITAILLELSSLPSFPDDAGTVIFMDDRDTILDELSYHKSWHFALMADPSGVSLERISPEARTQDPHNWASASSSSGYATPGEQNSQFRTDQSIMETIQVTPKVFTPDNDGQDDFGLIRYQTKEEGVVANLMIYDMSGRRVRNLLKNELLGTTGSFRWDGLDDHSNPLPQGIYIFLTKLFSLSGRTEKFKHSIVLARRML